MVRQPGQRLGPGRDSAGAPNSEMGDAPTVNATVTVVYQAENWSTSVTGSTAAYFTTGN